jgi:hypothetical protein
MNTAVHDAATALGAYQPPDDHDHIDELIDAWRTATDLRRDLALVVDQLATAIGERMDDRRYTAPGITVERRRHTTRTAWDIDDLLRVVLDTRVVDPDSGEIASDLDKVRRVWNLGAPRTTALTALGIDADDFCTTERRDGWTLRPYTTEGTP